MNKQELRKIGNKLDREFRIFKQPWFGYLMPKVNRYKGDWLAAEAEISKHVAGVVNTHHDKVIYDWRVKISRADLYTALMMIIKECFFEKGFTREQIALNGLKKVFPDVTWRGDATAAVENTGIDLIGYSKDGQRLGISIKGFAIKNDEADYTAHKSKLNSLTCYNRIMIIFVDEKNKKIDWEKVL